MTLTTAETRAAKAEEFKFCKGIKLSYIKENVTEILSVIGKNDIFNEYTKHDISHIEEMLNIAEWLIPEKTKSEMTCAEWLMLVLAIYFHDMGMVVTTDEYKNRDKSDFIDFKKKIEVNLDFFSPEDKERFLYQEFVRERHAARIKSWLSGETDITLGDGKSISRIINDILKCLDSLFKKDLGVLCESHHYENIDELDTEINYGNSPQEKVNLYYLAVILRIVDLLSITSRTPPIQFLLINPNNPKSLIEWQKQMSVKSVTPMSKTDDIGEIKKDLQSDTIKITAYFDNPDLAEGFFGLMSYIKEIEKEINYCYDSVRKTTRTKDIQGYEFPWRHVNSEKVEAKGFEPKQLQFTLNQENILQLLIGHTLYNDSSVALRELVQNSIDAIKLQKIVDKEKGVENDSKIEIHWDSKTRDLEFWDNGTGMTREDVENYLLKVGASKYSSAEFKKKYNKFNSISKFGIGILTCFMIADNIDIQTSNEQEKEVNVIAIRNVDGKYLLKKIAKQNTDPRIRNHGTVITLHVRENIDMSDMIKNLEKWILLPGCKVEAYYDDKKTEIGFISPKCALEAYLKNSERFSNSDNYKVVEDSLDGIKIAYILYYNSYLKEWNLCSLKDLFFNEAIPPIGTCIEGIRVEFNTPGFESKNVIALADIRNGSNHINVARSSIEWDDRNNNLLSIIYKLYSRQIQEQLSQLQNKGFSDDWVASEADFLTKNILEYNINFRRHISEEGLKPINEKVLMKEIDQIKCIMVEDKTSRELKSAYDIQQLSEISIIDSKMINAAEILLKEVKSSSGLRNIITTIDKDTVLLKNDGDIFCDYNPRSIIHNSALNGKQIKSIEVNKPQRIISLVYSSTVTSWKQFKTDSHIINIPEEKFEISGIEDEIGVKIDKRIFLSFSNPITEYILKEMPKFKISGSSEEAYLFKIFLNNIFKDSILGVHLKKGNDKTKTLDSLLDKEHINMRSDYEKLWQKIDKQEFAELLLSQKFILYSTSDWYRNA